MQFNTVLDITEILSALEDFISEVEHWMMSTYIKAGEFQISFFDILIGSLVLMGIISIMFRFWLQDDDGGGGLSAEEWNSRIGDEDFDEFFDW